MKHFGDVATVLFDFSLSQFVLFLHFIPDRLDDDQIRSLCGELTVFRFFVQSKISLDLQLQLMAK